MPQSQSNRQRKKAHRQHYMDDGGRRLDEYVHDEHPNPLDLAAKRRQEERENAARYGFWFFFEALIFFTLMFILAYMMTYHTELHQENDCNMTYIYRPMIFNPIEVKGNTVEKYKLIRYHEGHRDESVLSIDIPVLFVPGSSGSGKQVRSLATTVTNMTHLMGSAFPHRFVFYACDFDEEFSFLSGATLIRQREFVVQSIETILNRYSVHGIKKLLLLGHSFGGTILHSLPAHHRADPKWMDLVITLGAPIAAPPFRSDGYMEDFYGNTIKAWNKRAEEVKHISVVSYSGGHKDFMVPDYLARSPYRYTEEMVAIPDSRDTRVIFRPSWSLRDVACEVDHNCLAWCYQLVRHISSLVIKYGKEWKKPGDGAMKGSREIVRDYYAQEYGTSWPRRTLAWKEKPALFHSSMYDKKRTLKVPDEKLFISIDVNLEQYDIVVVVYAKTVNCPEGVEAIAPDISFRSPENFTTFGTKKTGYSKLRMMPTYYETASLKGELRIGGGNPQCKYEIDSVADLGATMYRRLMDSTTLPFIAFLTLLFSAFIPMSKDNRLPPPFDYIFEDLPEGYYIFIKITGAAAITCLIGTCRSFVERNSLTYLIWIFTARLASFLVGLPLQPVVKAIACFVERRGNWFRLVTRAILTTTAMYMSVYNVNFAYAFILFLYLFKVGPHSKNGACLIVASCAIQIAIGMAGNVRDGPAGVFERGLIDGETPQGVFHLIFLIFYDAAHPLLFSFISLVFGFLINTADMLEGVETISKERITGVFYALLAISLIRMTNLESMAVCTAYYLCIFETYREYKELKANSPITIT